MDENESGKDPTRRCRKRERNGEKGAVLTADGDGENEERERREAGADRERNLSIADEFNGVAFRYIPVELTA